MSSRIRLLPFAAGDGPYNMAADEALLTSAVDGTASFRCYGWSRATLSLGYFQPAAPALAEPALAGLAWVRRPSGGSALVHHHELTYALALPSGPAWRPPPAGWGWGFHEIIRAALARLGIETHPCREERKKSSILCFLHHTPGDLLLGSCKIAGSAQRKRRGALLQHGGILLAQKPPTPLPLPGHRGIDRHPSAGRRLAGRAGRRAGSCYRLERRAGRLDVRRETSHRRRLAALPLLRLEPAALTHVASPILVPRSALSLLFDERRLLLICRESRL